MTIVVLIKVNDGIVLASDSLTTIYFEKQIDGKKVYSYVYKNANKIFNLRKGCPIGAMTWGSGSIGKASISTLAKDFRKKITEDGDEWKIDPSNYTLTDIVKKFKQFIFDNNYELAYKDWEKVKRPYLGLIVAGYSSGEDLAEEWEIEIVNGECKGPNMIRKKEFTGASWRGQVEALRRLYIGFSPALNSILKKLDLDTEKVKEIIKKCKQELTVSFVVEAMPIQDAINLAKFLVYTTIQYSKFSPGTQIVGGPIEVATITKHEHFKWVQRKHYYNIKLNENIKYSDE